jgi:hypothetical protein
MDIQLYRRAVAEQFPLLDLSGFRLLGEGGVFWVFETDCKLAACRREGCQNLKTATYTA